jgi:hypothetical protein
MWSVWAAWLLGRRPPREIVEAATPLSLPHRLTARRVVRRGEVATQAGVARYAVALARQKQRAQPKPTRLLALGAVMCSLAFIALWNGSRHGWNASTVVLLFVAVVAILQVLVAIRGRRSAPAAEIANLEFLERAGAPYPPDADPRPAEPPTPALAMLVSLPTTFLLYDLIYGVLALALDNGEITLVRVVERGALWAALMTICMTVIRDRQRQKEAGRPTAGSDPGRRGFTPPQA